MDERTGEAAHELIDLAMGALDKRAPKRNTPNLGSKNPASAPPARPISNLVRGRIYGQTISQEEGGEEEGRQEEIRQEDGEAESPEAQGSAPAQRQEEGCQEGRQEKGRQEEGGGEEGRGTEARTGSQAGARPGTEARHGGAETSPGTQAGARAGSGTDEPQLGTQAGRVLGLGADAQARSRQTAIRAQATTIEGMTDEDG
jgi:hypothetical protein